MILRSITKHVRDQNWFAVGLDFLIVVVGVFIGIQVANWNQSMADRRLGNDYVERLSNDLRNDLVMLQGVDAYYEQVLASVREAWELLRQPSPDPKQLLQAVYRATEINYAPQTRATWDQIVSSGHIGLLPHDAAGYLGEYFVIDFVREANEDLNDSKYREHVRRLIPLPVQEAIRQGCSDVRSDTAVIVGFVENCVIDVEASAIEEVTATLKSDPDLLPSMNWHYSHVWSASVNAHGLVVHVQKTLDALQRAQDKRIGSS